MSLLKEKIVKELPNTKGFLIDGYPREKEQGIQFERDVSHNIELPQLCTGLD